MDGKGKAKFLDTIEEKRRFVEDCETFLFDLDGVIWLQKQLIPGAAEVVECLRNLGKKVFFITNKNTISRENYCKKFERFGMKVNKNEIYTAAFATAYYMKYIAKFDKKVYMIGGKGLSEELDAVGIPNIGYGRDDVRGDLDIQDDVNFELDPEVGAVLCGYDMFISMNKLIKATSYLVRDSSCLFVVTNPDDRMPVPPSKGYIIPGTGCFAAYLEKAVRRSPVYAGKPSSVLFECIKKEHNIDPARTCMVGDTLETDILFGNRSGAKTLLVLTGNANKERLQTAINDSESNNYVPDFVIESIGDLLQPVKQPELELTTEILQS